MTGTLTAHNLYSQIRFDDIAKHLMSVFKSNRIEYALNVYICFYCHIFFTLKWTNFLFFLCRKSFIKKSVLGPDSASLSMINGSWLSTSSIKLKWMFNDSKRGITEVNIWLVLSLELFPCIRMFNKTLFAKCLYFYNLV